MDSVGKVCLIQPVLKIKDSSKNSDLIKMARTLFFRNVLSKFIENTYKKLIFSQYNIFDKNKLSFLYVFLISFQSSPKKSIKSGHVLSDHVLTFCCEVFFFMFFEHFSIIVKEVNQIRTCFISPCSHILQCTHYGPLQYLSACFQK